MADRSVPVDLLGGKDELGLFGTDEADTAIRDFIGIALSPLSSFLGLLDDLGACNDDVRAVAITGKSLLARADSLFDQLHANLGRAGVSILVGVEGKSWEPHGVASCVVKRLPIPDPKGYEAAKQRWEVRRSCAERMDALMGHPELAEDMLAHMEKLVARTRETSLAGQV